MTRHRIEVEADKKGQWWVMDYEDLPEGPTPDWVPRDWTPPKNALAGPFPTRAAARAAHDQKSPLHLRFEVSHPGEPAAGLYPFTDRILMSVDSGDPGGEISEFKGQLADFLKEWYDAPQCRAFDMREWAEEQERESLWDVAQCANADPVGEREPQIGDSWAGDRYRAEELAKDWIVGHPPNDLDQVKLETWTEQLGAKFMETADEFLARLPFEGEEMNFTAQEEFDAYKLAREHVDVLNGVAPHYNEEELTEMAKVLGTKILDVIQGYLQAQPVEQIARAKGFIQ